MVTTNPDRPNIKIVLKRKPPFYWRRENRAGSIYNAVLDPLIAELCELKGAFPKTVVYSKLKWCGYGGVAMAKRQLCTRVSTLNAF